MLDMQVIEALYLKDEEPYHYLHIKHGVCSGLGGMQGCRGALPGPLRGGGLDERGEPG